MPSVARRTPSTPTADAFDDLVLLHLGLGHAAYACRIKVRLFRLHTLQTAQLLHAVSICFLERKEGKTYLLIPGLLPLGDQHGICVAVLEQPLVQLAGDGLLLVVELVDVAAALMRDLEDGPHGLVSRGIA